MVAGFCMEQQLWVLSPKYHCCRHGSRSRGAPKEVEEPYLMSPSFLTPFLVDFLSLLSFKVGQRLDFIAIGLPVSDL